MPIHPPGKRNRSHKRVSSTGRKVVAGLSLTAMVDMFTVLTIFLLQNYNVTGQVIHIPKEVTLPKATSTKELKPSHIVTISSKELLLDDAVLMKFAEVKDNKDWMVAPLYTKLSKMIQDETAATQTGVQTALKKVVHGLNEKNPAEERLGKITVQSDKDMNFEIIKKIMFTVTEAGAAEINFAVTKKPDEKKVN